MERPLPSAPALFAPAPPVEVLWDTMPEEVRFVLRRKIDEIGPLPCMSQIGRHWRGGQWSITPFPGSYEGFGTIGMQEAAILVNRLRGKDG